MANLLNIRIEGEKGILEGNLENIFDIAKAKRLLRNAVDDMADAIEAEVQRTVPVGETGRLKLHPLDRDDTRIGIVEPGITQFARGGGPGVPGARGVGGRFIRGGAGLTPGELVARSTITLPAEPKHAVWVHDGTGIYGPRGTPIVPRTHEFMHFDWIKGIRRKKGFMLREVQGQKPQPYLTEAFLLINSIYVPARVELLRAQIAAAT